MAVGEKVESKFTWLLDRVEVIGTVRVIQDGTVRVDEDDCIDIEPDANYWHLIGYFRGNQPLMWHGAGTPSLLHCETYSHSAISHNINRWDPWGIPTKPSGQPFEVTSADGTQRRTLAVGDRVRVIGRWVIDHHPEYCSMPKPSTPRSQADARFGAR